MIFLFGIFFLRILFQTLRYCRVTKEWYNITIEIRGFYFGPEEGICRTDMRIFDFQKTTRQKISNQLSDPFLPLYHFSYIDNLPQWYFFWHQHETTAEFVLVTEGQGVLHMGEQLIPVSRGTICVIPPHFLHYFSNLPEQTLNYYSIGIPVEDSDHELSLFLRRSTCSILSVENDFFYPEASCQMILEHLEANGGIADDVVQSALYSFLLWICRKEEIRNSSAVISPKNDLQDVLTHISYHFSEHLTLDLLAHQFGISKMQLNRLFHRYCGMSPINYIIYYRIIRAIMLLNRTELSIAEISSRIGYQNPTHFIKLFHKYLGYTPAEFRNLYHIEEKQRGAYDKDALTLW